MSVKTKLNKIFRKFDVGVFNKSTDLIDLSGKTVENIRKMTTNISKMDKIEVELVSESINFQTNFINEVAKFEKRYQEMILEYSLKLKELEKLENASQEINNIKEELNRMDGGNCDQ
jgi:hypothetical protein